MVNNCFFYLIFSYHKFNPENLPVFPFWHKFLVLHTKMVKKKLEF